MIIVIMMFLDRKDELEALERRWDDDSFDLMVVYGRRRVGKTEIIKQFSKDKPHIYFLSPQDTEEMQIGKLVETVADHFGERKPDIHNWRDTVDYLKEKLESKKILLSIDEFPYLVESNKAVLSYLQGMVDSIESRSLLILCGSSVSFMESEVMSYKSPLYGRRSGQIDLKPFDFGTSVEVIKYPFQEAIRSYSVTGGTPMYLLNFDYDIDLEDNIKLNILDKTSFMYDEPEFLLRTELRNPNRYMAILEAIALGHTQPNRISNITGIDSGPLSKYLRTLRRLRLIKRDIPVTEERRKSKRSIYRIHDNFFRFWFRFVEPKRSWIEEAPDEVLKEDIMPYLDIYSSKIFENICSEAIWRMMRKDKLPCIFPKVGSWWFGEDEIDILGLNEKECAILFGECKWTNTPIGYSEVKNLKETAERVRWHDGERDEHYILFSKSGFEERLYETEDNIILYDLKDLEQLFGE